MKLIVAGHDAATPDEFAELAFGVDVELFTGCAGESAEQEAARLDAAREILRDLDGPAARFASSLMHTAERRRALTWRAA